MSQGCKKKQFSSGVLLQLHHPLSKLLTLVLFLSGQLQVTSENKLNLFTSDSLRDHRLSHVSPDNGAPSNSPTFLPFSSITGDVISQEQTVLHLH